tara:strand:- start:2413 stop:3420 length:1008 start_codon:yes stop_codon:yes gene_type:complete
MSEQEKSGEDLIEKVEQETTGDAVEETKEESKEFDPKAFNANDTAVESKEELKEETEEEPVEDSDDDDFNWNSVESEAKEEKEEIKDDDWDSVEEEEVKPKSNVKEDVYDWETLAEEMGVEATDEKSFKEAVANAMNKPAPVNDTIQNLQGFLKMADMDLVKSDLEASGLEKEDVTETLDKLQDSGLLKREAVMIRKNVQNYIRNERDRLVKVEKEQRQTQEKATLNSKKKLQSYIKEKGDFFGGKVGTKEKKELYNYITSGNFADDIYANHANVADAAFLWKYKDKIFKMLQGQGMEKGKAAVLNKITNPNLGRRSRQVDTTPKSGFDPVEFMK